MTGNSDGRKTSRKARDLIKQARLSSYPESNKSTDPSERVTVRQSWFEAAKEGDVDRWGALVTTDIVVNRKDSAWVCGEAGRKASLLEAVGLYDIKREIISSRVLIDDRWAIEIDEIERTVSPLCEEMEILGRPKTVLVHTRQPETLEKIARVMELAD